MKNLVLLYRGMNNRDEVTIKELLQVRENNDHYLFGEDGWRRLGVLKKKVGIVCKKTFYGGSNAARFPIELPYMGVSGWSSDVYFIFVNKTKYDENPNFYYDMIKNYRED